MRFDAFAAAIRSKARAELRHANRDRQTRERHRFTGGMHMALTEPPSHEKSWGVGAVGERKVGGMLDEMARGSSMLAINDRRVPGSSANIDHIAIAPSGAYVIDTKRYRDKLVENRMRRGSSSLYVCGSSNPQMFEAMHRQLLRRLRAA